ncbi:MAG: NADH-quinone oxidoreductase subunit B family protein [Actinocatenispora sp.]
MGLEENLPGILLVQVEKLVNTARRMSMWPAQFGLACCAIEMMTTGAARYDTGRWGMEVFRASPRQADLMIVAGRVSQKMAPVLRRIYDQMADPKWVLSMGVCASSGGMFNNYAIVQGVDHVVPVDMYLPGCPPRPEMLLDAILKLHEKISVEPLGEKRRVALAEQAAREAPPVVRPGTMPSSYRHNKAKRKQWVDAAAEGREEQLRIENWMHDNKDAAPVVRDRWKG